MLVTVKEGYETIPTGEYLIQVTNIEETENKFDPDKPQLKWTLEIVTGDYEGKNLIAFSSTSDSVKGKLVRWASALGLELVDGDAFDTDDLIGRQCLAVVLVKAKDDGTEFNKVDDLKARKLKTQTRRPVPANNPVSKPVGVAIQEKANVQTVEKESETDDDFDPFESE